MIAFLAYIALIVVLCVTGVLADETGSLLNSKAPLMSGMTVLHRPDVRHPRHRLRLRLRPLQKV